MLAYVEDILLQTLSYKYSLLITLNGVLNVADRI